MSLKAMVAAWLAPVKANQKLVLLALADHANDDGECWPGLKGIAKKCGITERAVIKCINALVKHKLIFKRTQFDKNGRQKSNIYMLNMEGLGVNIIHPGVNVVQGEGEQYSGGRVNIIHPNHHIEPSLETNIREVLQTSPSSALKAKPAKILKPSAEVLEIFQYWQQVMVHPKAKLDDKRKSKIVQALKLYSAEELKQAINGCASTPFNMGHNDSNQRYDDLELILRDAKHIEQFINSNSIVHLQKTGSGKFVNQNDIFAGAI